MTFTLITTGGTIDKVYGTGLNVRDLHIGNPVVPEILRDILHMPCAHHIELFRKDSLDITSDDRSKICQAVKEGSSKLYLITHGTDTMIETARIIKENLGLDDCKDKRVVLVGSSQPACMGESDALARIGFALGVLFSSSEPGVIIAMDGIHTDPETCKKWDDGIFRS
jgi:L-asparaginase